MTRRSTALALATALGLAASAVYVQWRTREALRAHPPRGRFVTVDGVRLHYIERGEGTPLVLLHGNGSSTRELELSGLVDLAARRYRVVAFDRPGFGHSTRPRGMSWTAEAQARLIVHALQRLDALPAVVLGHSWGTLVALALAEAYPSAVTGLVLASGYYFPTLRPDALMLSMPAWPGVGTLARHTVTPLTARLAWPLLERVAFGPSPTPPAFERFPKWLALRPSVLHAAGSESGAMTATARRLSRRYQWLRMPVSVVAGEDDRIVDLDAHARRLHAMLADSDLRIVRGAGHMVHHVDPARVVRAVDAVARRAALARPRVRAITAPQASLDEPLSSGYGPAPAGA